MHFKCIQDHILIDYFTMLHMKQLNRKNKHVLLGLTRFLSFSPLQRSIVRVTNDNSAGRLLGNKNVNIGIFTGGTSAKSKNIFTDISRYPTGKHEIQNIYFQKQKLIQHTVCISVVLIIEK